MTFIGIVAIVVIIGFVIVANSTCDIKLAIKIFKAKRCIRLSASKRTHNVRVFVKHGATKIDPSLVSIWIATTSDVERERLSTDQTLFSDLRNDLASVGYPLKAIPSIKFVIQSQETVDREYGGNWREAMEMP